jgi:L-Ala-D/L-Glu epimerase
VRHLNIRIDTWPLANPFQISRGSKTNAETVIVEIVEDGAMGRGEAVPYARYGETLETVSASIEAIGDAICNGLSRDALREAMLPGAARSAIDLALWDLECKIKNKPISDLLNLTPLKPLTTAFTLSLDSASNMAKAAREAEAYSLIKIKLGGHDGIEGDMERLQAIRAVLPTHKLIADINEGWSMEALDQYAHHLKTFKLDMIEQPVGAKRERNLDQFDLPFCADESLHDCASFYDLDPGYQWVNIKLDKTGGLTEALELVRLAREQNKKIMIGCMVASSLAMAPAFILGQLADLVDLDGPLWLTQDCDHGLTYQTDIVQPPSQDLWG